MNIIIDRVLIAPHLMLKFNSIHLQPRKLIVGQAETKKHRSSPGFSLIELLVVIFIIAVLAAVLLPNLMGFRKRARDSRKKQELMEAKKALRLYYNDHQSYPEAAIIPAAGSAFTDGGVTYMKEFPEYEGYAQCNSGEQFALTVALENEADEDIDDSQTECDGSLTNCAITYDAATDFVVCED